MKKINPTYLLIGFLIALVVLMNLYRELKDKIDQGTREAMPWIPDLFWAYVSPTWLWAVVVMVVASLLIGGVQTVLDKVKQGKE